MKTVELMKKVEFTNSFSYIFSARPGTPAFKYNKINKEVVKKRLIEFQDAAENIKINYKKKLINKKTKVLFENKMKSGNRYFGRDEYFNSIIVESNSDLTGLIKNVKILKGNQNTLFGEIISNVDQTNYAA
tara:strand:- start:148 stop:540 length:393 start_codon:yes stop_codon:yes gene_type:complete